MLKLIPILTRPGFLTLKNNWCNKSLTNKQFWRDIIVILCISYLLIGLYEISSKGFGILHKYDSLTAMFLPDIFNSLIFVLILLVFFSSCTFSLTNLYLSEDLDLILASPISKVRFFVNKFFQILVSSSWIVFLGSLPCLLALGKIYQVSFSFFIETFILCLPLVILPVAASIVCTTLITRFLNGNHLKILLPIITVFFLLTIFSKSHTFFSTAQKKDIDSVISILNNLSHFNKQTHNNFWYGELITKSLKNISFSYPYKLILLYFTALAGVMISYAAIIFLHNDSLSRVKSPAGNLNLSSKYSQSFIRRFFPFFSSYYRALLLKEFKIFARDLSHLIQIAVVLILCMFYLYNFQNIFNSKNFLLTPNASWQHVTFLCNLGFGALIITSLCTRFVYSSISLEGKSFWVLYSSPHSIKKLLHNKFHVWLIPVIIFSSVILISGSLALQAEPYLILLTFVSSIVISYSITGLGIGLGAMFATFDWVHNSQIFASIGSVIFIISSFALISVNIVILAVIVFMETILSEVSLTPNQVNALFAASSVIFVIGNYLAAKFFLSAGAKGLRDRNN